VTLLIHHPPQIMVLPLNHENHLIQVPHVTGSGAPAAALIDIHSSQRQASLPHGFVCQGDAALRHELLDVPIAQAEAKVEPDSVADDLRWEPMALIQIGCEWCAHVASMPHEAGAGNRDGPFDSALDDDWPCLWSIPNPDIGGQPRCRRADDQGRTFMTRHQEVFLRIQWGSWYVRRVSEISGFPCGSGGAPGFSHALADPPVRRSGGW
jgi:hypothetical protein